MLRDLRWSGPSNVGNGVLFEARQALRGQSDRQIAQEVRTINFTTRRRRFPAANCRGRYSRQQAFPFSIWGSVFELAVVHRYEEKLMETRAAIHQLCAIESQCAAPGFTAGGQSAVRREAVHFDPVCTERDGSPSWRSFVFDGGRWQINDMLKVSVQ